ncbi:hypothetical protein REPUB_Repub13aG0009300 [Reevesia pubescens]
MSAKLEESEQQLLEISASEDDRVQELLECIRTQSSQREVELEVELKRTKVDVEELRAYLMDKETELQSISEENEGLNMKTEKNQSDAREYELAQLEKLEADLTELKANLIAKEAELQRNNGKHVDRTLSRDSNYNPIMGSPNSEDMDDDSPKKKNDNMLKTIGVLWKKGQK